MPQVRRQGGDAVKQWKQSLERWFFQIENEIMFPFLAVGILVVTAFAGISWYNGYSMAMDAQRARAKTVFAELRQDIWYLDGRITETELEEKYSMSPVSELRITTADGRVLTGPEERDGHTRVLLSEEVGKHLHWTAEYILDLDEFHERIFEEETFVIVGAVACLLVIAQVSVFLAWSLTRPIRSMSAACLNIQENQKDFQNYRFEEVARRDEIGQLARTFEGLLKELKEYTRMEYTSRMAATLAHEIKNPLAGIRAGLQVLLGRAEGESEKLLCESMLKEIDRVTGLINNLFTLSVRREIVRTVIPLERFFAELLGFYGNGLAGQGISFEAHTPEGLTVFAGENELRQILQNIMTNSIKALAGRPEAGISLTAEETADGRVMLSLSDNGRGMEPEELEKALEPFYTKSINGVGLGLPIVRRLMEQNHGELTMESQAGVGTTVRLIFDREGEA